MVNMVSPLSRRDADVLAKMKDPEANPSASVVVDSALPKDPIITDDAVYDQVSHQEREIVQSIQQLEAQLAVSKQPADGIDPIRKYHDCITLLADLIAEYPEYASARNNRAQALRRLYGDSMLLYVPTAPAILQDVAEHERLMAAKTALSDLDQATQLLTPKTPSSAVSPQAGKILSLAHTQRAAIYHVTAKGMVNGVSSIDENRRESGWAQLDFEKAASQDFALGGRYGNEIAKGLAVSTNPTAKLCGQIVREAMRKEYGPAIEGL